MLQYIRAHYTALYLTDANGNPTQHDLLDPNGVSLLTGAAPTFLPPNTFATNQWSLATGSSPAQIVINISVLPANNGSPITAIQYRVGNAAWITLPGAVTGAYPVTMAATSTAYDISLRAVNIVGPSAQSVAKTVTSGAPAATAPSAFGPSQWTLATGTEPASLALNILSLPADGGSAITAVEYRVGSGEWVAFPNAETGPRSITTPQGSTSYSVTIRAVNEVNAGPAAMAKTATSAAPAQQAPSVQTSPTISGSTTVGSILTRTAGTATGIPTPTRATAWLRNGEVIPGETGNTLDTSGFAADDVITTRDDWTNSQGTASGTSAPWTLTVQPAITATIDLQPAGQQSSITFNVVIDGSPTIAQGSTSITATRVGTTNQWTFTAPVEGPISFAATKAGYTAFSDATRTVAPALSALVIRDRELMVDNEPTADRTLDISAPDRFDATGINIAADQYTDGMKVIAAPVIERTGGVITASRGGLFSWFAEQEPVFFSHNYYRGATPQTATLIPGTTDVESYTVDPVADGGKNIYRRDRIVNALQASVSVFSNGIAVAEAPGWWNAHANLLADIDYTNNRARINGQTFSDLTDAEAAGVIKTLGTVKYIDIPNLSAFSIAARGTAVRDSNTLQAMFYLDDGEDGDGADNYLTIDYTTTGKITPYAVRDGKEQISMQSAATINTGATAKVAGTFRGTTAHFNNNGQIFNDTSAVAPAGLVRMCLFDKFYTSRPWLGAKGRIILINAAMTDAEIATLYGEI